MLANVFNSIKTLIFIHGASATSRKAMYFPDITGKFLGACEKSRLCLLHISISKALCSHEISLVLVCLKRSLDESSWVQILTQATFDPP